MPGERQSPFLGLATVLGLCAMSGLTSPDEFKWSGAAYNSNTANDNWDDEHNWIKVSGDGQSLWPHHEGDVVTIDDVTPEDEVEQNYPSNLTIGSLVLGDGHTLNLTYGMTTSILECVGIVKLQGNGTLTTSKVFRVYSDEDTTISFESGSGSLHVDGGA